MPLCKKRETNTLYYYYSKRNIVYSLLLLLLQSSIIRAPLQMAAESFHVSTKHSARAAQAQWRRLGALYKMSEQAGGEGGGPPLPAEPATTLRTAAA